MAIKIINDFLPIANPNDTGIVKPDNDTITISNDGAITSNLDLPENVVGSDNYTDAKLWKGTLEEYNALTEHLDSITYFIIDDNETTDIIQDDVISKTSTFSSQKITELTNNILPSQENQEGSYLKTNGTEVSWTRDVVNYNNITNCITEIPQDIKLELVDGTLTLKAGSKVYVPNGKNADGSNKFDVVVISVDKTRGAIGTYTGSSLLFFDTVSESLNQAVTNTSGTTAPTSGNGNWYDTTNNFVKTYSSGVVNQSSKLSLPIAIMTRTNGNWTSIDQIFNGFGYIGSTIFALPGVKGLIPNGRNADGSLTNRELIISNVLITTRTTEYDNYDLILNDIEIANSILVYDDINNVNKKTDGTIVSYTIIGKISASSNGVISLFQPKSPLKVLDYNDTSYISTQAFPSNKYIDLTLGASGATYTAPANGWFQLTKSTTASGQYINIAVNKISTQTHSTGSGQNLAVFAPVLRGANVGVYYTAGGTTSGFRFIYAEGEL